MRVLILHNAVAQNSTVEARDVLAQRDAVQSALRGTGIEAHAIECGLDLDRVYIEIQNNRPDVVFNLVESLAGTDRLMSLVPLLLDSMQVPYTGARSSAILATGNKVFAKERLRHAGLPTPKWCASDDAAKTQVNAETQWIIKPIWEHASIGMDDDSVFIPQDSDDLFDRLHVSEQRVGCPMFAEHYIAGREFNLSLLAGKVLPPAEIDFSAFPDGKPRIVGHAAKWNEASFEYQQTPRRFDFPESDHSILEALSELSLQCWSLFGLTGFARVDFRVDELGQPWILEVNVNPCLSPDAGFAAALSAAGIEFSAAMLQLIDTAYSGLTEPVFNSLKHSK